MKKLVKRGAPKTEGNVASNFLKVDDGQSATGIFRGEIFEFWQKWPKGGKKEVFTEPTAGAASRFKVNFVTMEGGKPVAKVWEFGVSVYNMLAELQKDFDLEKTNMKISRRGVDKNTQWMIIPLGAASEDGLKTISQVSLNILDGVQDQPQKASGDKVF